MTLTWSRTPADAWAELARIEAQKIEDEVVALVDGLTDQAAAWMRQEARWTDRTGDARAGLYADILHVARQTVSMLLSHGPTISYAQWLETVGGGRYSILPDAVDQFAPLLFRGLQEIAAKHSGR